MKRYRRDILLFLFMLICVSLAGELKFHPFGGYFSRFQVSLGSPTFLLFILFMRRPSLLFTGACMGVVVVIFRAVIDVYSTCDIFSRALLMHAATFFYYLFYAGCFSLARFDRKYIYSNAVKVAVLSVLAEVVASVAELLATNVLVNNSWHFVTVPMLLKLMFIAVLRCFFILSFFFLAQIYTIESRMQQERREKERMLLMITNLYDEVVQLHESQNNVENATREFYKIYEEINQKAATPEEKILAQKMLALAGTVHSIKKDNQRIYVNLMALTNKNDSKTEDYMSADEIIKLSVDTYTRYAKSLNKQIKFYTKISAELPLLHVYTLLSLLNNLLSNAVEGIFSRGIVEISLAEKDDMLQILVDNTGSFIPIKRLKLIFQPGYTTKFDSNGNASTGVGLSYLKNHVKNLGGMVTIDSDGVNNVECKLLIPLNKIKRG